MVKNKVQFRSRVAEFLKNMIEAVGAKAPGGRFHTETKIGFSNFHTRYDKKPLRTTWNDILRYKAKTLTFIWTGRR